MLYALKDRLAHRINSVPYIARVNGLIYQFMIDYKIALTGTLIWLLVTLITATGTATIQPDFSRAPATFNHDWLSRLSYVDPVLEKILIEAGMNENASTMLVKSPGFPFLITRPLVLLTHWSIEAAQFVGNKLCTLLAAISVTLLFASLYDQPTAQRTVGYLLFSLFGGYVFLMSYPEPFYIALWAAGFYCYFRNLKTDQFSDLAYSSFYFSLAVLSRPQGAPTLIPALFAGILIRFVSSIRQRSSDKALLEHILWESGLRLLLLCVIPTAIFAAWLAYTSQVTGIPVAPLTMQQFFGRSGVLKLPLSAIADTYTSFFYTGAAYWGINYETWCLTVALIGLSIMLILCIRRRIAWELFIFTLLTVVLSLASGNSRGLGRFVLATPLCIIPALIVPRKLDTLLWICGIAVTITLFVLNITANNSFFWQP
jgi:hypothetical protein